MFDIGFWELMILGVVALLVVGPERLPKLAYTAGKWIGKGRRMLASLKTEIDKEIKAEELKRILERQRQQLNPLEDAVQETSSALRDLSRETRVAMREAETRHKEEPDTGGPATGPAQDASHQLHDDKKSRSDG